MAIEGTNKCVYCGDTHTIGQILEQVIDGVIYRVRTCLATQCNEKMARDLRACLDMRTSLDVNAYHEINAELRDIHGTIIK